MGSLGDRFGRRGALAIGLAIMGSASVASALPPRRPPHRHPGDHGHRRRADHAGDPVDPHQRVHRPAERAQAIAIWSATAGMAVAIGPVTGGWLLEHFWWGSVFLVNVPVVIVALVLGQLFVPTSRDPAAPPVDCRRASVDRRPGRPRVGDHRGRPRLDRSDGARGLRRRRGAARRCSSSGSAHTPPDARHQLLPQPRFSAASGP